MCKMKKHWQVVNVISKQWHYDDVISKTLLKQYRSI